MVTSEYSVGKTPLLLSSVSETSAIPRDLREAVPLNTTSFMLLERNIEARCSPKTHRRASTILDLPHPLGPTIAVIPVSNCTLVFWAKLLNPWSSSVEINIVATGPDPGQFA